MTNTIQSIVFFAIVLSVVLFSIPSSSTQLYSIEAEQLPPNALTIEVSPDPFASEDTLDSDDVIWGGWEILIALLVIATGGSIAYLCYQAMLAWEGTWKLMALAPLVVIALWLTIILVNKLSDPASHQLWAFEVFSWAMGTTLYLVVLMTAKRAYLKAEQEKDS